MMAEKEYEGSVDDISVIPNSDEDLLNCIDFESDNLQESNTPARSVSVSIEVGLEFEDLEFIYGIYNAYAFSKGFGIKRRNVRKNYALFACHRSGFNPAVKQSESSHRLSSYQGIGCKAALHVYKENSSTMWKITKFYDVHNHEPCSPNSVTLLRSHKNFSNAAKSLTEAFSLAGVQVGKVPAAIGNSCVGFDSRDCYNHIAKMRKIMYEAGDAQAIQTYCSKRQADDPEFFYSIQFDDDSRMVNFVWIDSRSRRAYEHFGDVVTFDTTYRTSKYSMPFAPFVGLNHHMQSIMFGCALLHDETEDTFTWLFETWLIAVRGKMPISIIIDQDQAMGKAIEKVLPACRHRLCLWHITKKFPEKLSHVYHEHSDFKRIFNQCIYHSNSIVEFEEAWRRIIVDYNLYENEWLAGLFEIRSKWVPVYNRSIFFAGMSTTQRSESINAFFDGFVHSGTTLREFVTKYDLALDKRYESYRKEDFDSRHKERRLTLNMPLEEHAASVYTRNVFNCFHEQLSKSLKFSKEKQVKDGNQTTYKVWDRKVSNKSFTVVIDSETNIYSCSCMLFDWKSIFCAHVLAILHMKNKEQIPQDYILDRWCKHGNLIPSSGSCNSVHTDSVLRSFDLRKRHEMLDAYADKSERAYVLIRDKLDSLISVVVSMVNCEDAFSNQSNTDGSMDHTVASEVNLLDPIPSQTKGRKRLQSGIEFARSNSLCP